MTAWFLHLLLLFIEPHSARHHQLRGLKSIFEYFFNYNKTRQYTGHRRDKREAVGWVQVSSHGNERNVMSSLYFFFALFPSAEEA